MTPTCAVREVRSSRLPLLLDRYFWLIAGLLLAVLAGAQIGSALQESPTNDEPVHLTAGYVYLTTGVYNMDTSHPPLGRILEALPLLPLHLKRIPADMAWVEFTNLIWGNRVSADTIILRARLVVITLTLLFGVWFSGWTRRRFGSTVALLALTFFAFDPTLIAHGHYATTDLIASLGIFLASTLWADFLDRPNWKTLTAASLGLGFALASKYSAISLLFVLPVLYGIAWRRNRGRRFFTWRGAIGTLVVMSAGAGLIVELPFAPEVKTLALSPRSWEAQPLLASRPAARQTVSCDILAAVGNHTPLRAFGYYRGLYRLAQDDAGGIPSYLLGHFRLHGWWEYFPVAFLVKTPTGVLLACLVATLSLWRGRRHPPPFVLLCLALPPLVYFALAMRSSFNIGVRHILPIYPFLYVLLAFLLIEYGPALIRKAWPWTIAALIVLTAAESLSAYPHYLAFFNWCSGGPSNGPRYLLDSNIDWGQDMKNLGHYVNQHHMTPLCTALFEEAPPSYYGIFARDLNRTGMPEGVDNLPCAVAVSVNLLYGLYNAPEKFAALRKRQPVAKIGYSVYVYDRF